MAGGITGIFGEKMQAPSMPAYIEKSGAVLPRKTSRPELFAGLIWLSVIVTATFMMLAYANSPSPAGSAPQSWPNSSHIPRDTKRPELIMFVHPHCPCSRASMGELALLMAHCQGRVSAHVLFIRPAQLPEDWVQTDLWREASAIPGVIVHRDDGGREARLFNVETSGDLVLYDTTGQLTFHGGITVARGHSGDNAGRSAVQALLLNEPAQTSNSPVFGCSLFECRSPANP